MLNISNYQTKSGYSGLTKILNKILKDNNVSKSIKQSITDIYFINFIKNNNISLQDTIDQLNNIEINCKICNYKHSLFDICPNELKINNFKNKNGLYNFTEEFINNNKNNEYIKRHINYALDIQKKRILLNNISKIYNRHKKINDWYKYVYDYIETELNNFDYNENYNNLYNKFNIEVCKCEICGTPLYFFNQSCPNIGTKQGNNGIYSIIDKSLDEANEYELKHIKHRKYASGYKAWETKKKLMKEDPEYDKNIRDVSKLNTKESRKKAQKTLHDNIQKDPKWWENVNKSRIETRNKNGFKEICNANLYRGQDPIINEKIKQSKIKNGTDIICNQNLIRNSIQKINNDNINFMKLLPGNWKNSSFYMLHSWAVRNNIEDDLLKDYKITDKNIEIINLKKPLNYTFNNVKDEKYFHWRRIVLQYIFNKTICLNCGKKLNDVNQSFCCDECRDKYYNNNNNNILYIMDWKNKNKKLINELEKQIKGLTEALNNSYNPLIYGFYFNNKLFYLGETVNLSLRILVHLKNIIDYPLHWMFWRELNIKFEIRIIKTYNNISNLNKKEKMKFLRQKESKAILKLRPLIQKCVNGEDDIIPLEQRNFKEICNKLNINYDEFQLEYYNYYNKK